MNRPATRLDSSAFDVQKVRADFPILAREVHGKPLVYLDTAASAQRPLAVIEATDFLATIQVRASDTGQPVTDFVKTSLLEGLESAAAAPQTRSAA